MLNIAETLHRWCHQARPFALAAVVDVRGSAPLPVGTSVVVDEDGNAIGRETDLTTDERAAVFAGNVRRLTGSRLPAQAAAR